MEVPWSRAKAEAGALAADIGRSGREHHSLLRRDAPALAAVRARGVPGEHREWAWPTLLHAQSERLRRALALEGGDGYARLLEGVEMVEQSERSEKSEKSEKSENEKPSSSLEQAQEMAMERFEHMNPFQERKVNRILLAYAKCKETFYYSHVSLMKVFVFVGVGIIC